MPRTVRRVTIPYPEAMAMLSICRSSLDKLCNREVFTARRPRGKGKGKVIFLYLDEIELYAESRSEAAVLELRARNRRL